MAPTNHPPPTRLAHIRSIKGWVADVLAPPADAVVMVSELTCSEPGCPPVETVIALMHGPGETIRHKVHRPIVEVTREDIEQLAAPPQQHPH